MGFKSSIFLIVHNWSSEFNCSFCLPSKAIAGKKSLNKYMHSQNMKINTMLAISFTYALTHRNPIVKKFANIAPMGANIALLCYLYDVSFDRKLHINEQSIRKVYKLPNESEQDATVVVVRDLLHYRGGIYDIDYLNYDEITLIIDELCTNCWCDDDDDDMCVSFSIPPGTSKELKSLLLCLLKRNAKERIDFGTVALDYVIRAELG